MLIFPDELVATVILSDFAYSETVHFLGHIKQIISSLKPLHLVFLGYPDCLNSCTSIAVQRLTQSLSYS